METTFKLTVAEIDVLKAYRDNTQHNRKSQVVDGLRRRGMLAWEGNVFDGSFQVTRTGLMALRAHECGAW